MSIKKMVSRLMTGAMMDMAITTMTLIMNQVLTKKFPVLKRMSIMFN